MKVVSEMELLTVVIPVRNRKGMLRETLKTISNQQPVQRGKVGLIVVDNGSTDGAREMVEQWMKEEAPEWLRVEITEEEMRGACAARNRGLAAARGEWVMFFDSDDLMGKGHLRNVTEGIERLGDEADVIYWDVAFRRYDGRRGVYRGRVGDDVWMNVIMRGALSTQRYCCRRKVMMAAGGWDESVEVWNDWELSVRLTGGGARLKYLKEAPTVTVIEHGDSITGSRFGERGGKREVALERARRYAMERGLMRVVRLIDFKGAVLAGDYAREGELERAGKLMDEIAGRGMVPRWKLHVSAWIERMAGRGASVVVRVME